MGNSLFRHLFNNKTGTKTNIILLHCWHVLESVKLAVNPCLPGTPSAIPDDPAEWASAKLIPVALDNLSPRCFAVFLFGCHVVQLLSRVCSFPPVMLLLAKTLPVTCTDTLLVYCYKEFYYDTANQILYILESKLQNAGQFVSVLLHSMAYISSGAYREVTKAAFTQQLLMSNSDSLTISDFF